MFNVGVFDGLTSEEENYKYDLSNQSIETIFRFTFHRRYLVNKLEVDLMDKYVDIDGKKICYRS